MYPQLFQKSLCRQGWPQTYNPPGKLSSTGTDLGPSELVSQQLNLDWVCVCVYCSRFFFFIQRILPLKRRLTGYIVRTVRQISNIYQGQVGDSCLQSQYLGDWSRMISTNSRLLWAIPGQHQLLHEIPSQCKKKRRKKEGGGGSSSRTKAVKPKPSGSFPVHG